MSSIGSTANSRVSAQTEEISVVTLRKVTWRVIPFLFVLYVIAWLDRVNVSFAGLQMNADLGFSSTVFGLGSGIFFLGYCLFEIPSNIILERVGARLWISRIMVSWGLVSAAMMFVRTPAAFYLLRFLLGVAEAGFFPGVIYYLSLWYPVAHRARAIAAFMTAVPVTGLIGAPVSGALLELDGLHGLAGWQWLFLLEGIPAVILGTTVLFYLKDRPETTHWLRPEERNWLIETLAAERKARVLAPGIRVALTDFNVWKLGLIFLLVAAGFYGYSFWAPLVIKSLTGLGNFKVGLVLGAISAVTIVGMLLNSYHSDRTGERAIHTAVPLFVMGVGLIGSAWLHQAVMVIIALALVPLGHCASYGPFWSTPTQFFTGRAAAAGIALVTMIANIGSFAGPTLIGFMKARTGTHTAAFSLLGVLAILAALLALQLRTRSMQN
ncbi:MAG TPA: MFS transporter [Candidatus Udaeobacter sp.]|nr:MFS transporter [Candidatus Udaeobacter sp.]